MSRALVETLRPASWLSRASLAAELDISESTVDEMVRRGVLPKPVKLSGGCVRWQWAAVDQALASLVPAGNDGADPFMNRLRDASKEKTESRRGTA